MPNDLVSKAIKILGHPPFETENFAMALYGIQEKAPDIRLQDFASEREPVPVIAQKIVVGLSARSESLLVEFLKELHKTVPVPQLTELLKGRGLIVIEQSYRFPIIQLPAYEHSLLAELLENAAGNLNSLDALLQSTVDAKLRKITASNDLAGAIQDVIKVGVDGKIDLELLVEEIWIRFGEKSDDSARGLEKKAIKIWVCIRDQRSTFHPSDFCYLPGGDPFAGRKIFRDAIKRMLAPPSVRQADQVQAILISGRSGFGKSYSRKLVKHTLEYLEDGNRSGQPTVRLVSFADVPLMDQNPRFFVEEVFQKMGVDERTVNLTSAEDFTTSFMTEVTRFSSQCWIFIDDLDEWVSKGFVDDIIGKLLRCLGKNIYPSLRMIVLSNRLYKILKLEGRCHYLDFDQLALLEKLDVERFVVEWRKHNRQSRRAIPAEGTDPRIGVQIDDLMTRLPPQTDPRRYHEALNQALRTHKDEFLMSLWKPKI